MIERATFKQILILTSLTLLFVVPHLLSHGTNIVTHTYAFGSGQFWSGLSPYADPKGAGDWFKYSPLFAWFYTPFAALKSSPQAALWGLFNILCFWTGICVWFPWRKLESKWLWLGIVFCSMEADGSFRYQQMNAALVGLTLLGLYFYAKDKFQSAGVLLTIVTNVKILPGLFLVGLIAPLRKKYVQGIFWGLTVCLVIPFLIWGATKTITYHLDWYALLRRDTHTDGLLDIATVLKRLGFQNTKAWALYPFGIVSLSLFFIQRWVPEFFDWDLWIPFGLLTLLLVNPRTESPTFVLAGPAYLFLQRYFLKQIGPLKTVSIVLWISGIFFITICMNDIWPKIIWNPGSWLQFNKTLGVFLLWLMSVILILNRLFLKPPFK